MMECLSALPLWRVIYRAENTSDRRVIWFSEDGNMMHPFTFRYYRYPPTERRPLP